MVSASHVLAFVAVVTVLIAIPGPSVLFTISRALTVGRRAALLTVVGNELGLCGRAAAARAARVTPVRPLRAVRDGFVVGVANPKTIVFFVAGLPEFTTTAPGHLPVPAQMLILGALFPVIALVLDSAWAAIAGTARQWLVGSPRRLALIGGTGGLVMIGLGVSIAATGRKD